MELDQTILEDLQEAVGGEAALGEIIETFIEEMATLAEKVRAAWQVRDIKAARLAMHSMASDAAMLGATRLSTQWRTAEHALDEGDWGPTEACAGALVPDVSDLSRALEKWRRGR